MMKIKKFLSKYWKYYLIIFLPLSIFLAFYVYRFENNDDSMHVYFWSLNKGRAVFIRTSEHKNILIGGGQNAEVIREITKTTPFYRRKIDVIVTPSATPAQIGGLIDVIDRYEVSEVIMPKVMATSSVFTHLVKEIRKNKIHVEEVERGDEINIEDGIVLSVLFPYKNFKFNKTSLPELGLSISYGSTKVYLLGNLSRTIQKDIFNNIEINKGENILEFYNSMAESKVFGDLVDKIDPKFTFSTKEKSMHLISDGEGWKVEK